MSTKDVCTNCRKAFSQGHNVDTQYEQARICPDCGRPMFFVSNKFKPPKKTDTKAWEIVAYLIESGYPFYSAYDRNGYFVPYPNTMAEAEEFIRKRNEMKIESFRKTNAKSK